MDVNLLVDGVRVTVPPGTLLLEAARAAGIYVPHLCAHPDLPPGPGLRGAEKIYRAGAVYRRETGGEAGGRWEGCGLCVVKVEGRPGLALACATPVEEGLEVSTVTPGIEEHRRRRLADILATHPHACLTCAWREGCSREPCSSNVPVEERCCSRLGDCELQRVADYLGIPVSTPRYVFRDLPVVRSEPLFDIDYNLCIGCTRCVRACRDLRGVGALDFVIHRGEVLVGTAGPTLGEAGCRFCGACVEVCPTGALSDRQRDPVPCRTACPAGIDVPRYVRLIAEERFEEALGVVREKVPFPGVLGRVCFHPCEEVCRRRELGGAVSICRLKRFAAGHDRGAWRKRLTQSPPSGRRVAVVGSGPAGLTAAYYLSLLGHGVTVFEALPEPGGMMRAGIPAYRLPREVLDREIEEIRRAGVEIRTATPVVSLDELVGAGQGTGAGSGTGAVPGTSSGGGGRYDAVLLATGAQAGIKPGIPGEDTPGVVDAVHFLREVNLGRRVTMAGRVAVIGGGNAAVDAARTALRLGASEVTVIYRRTRAEMPAFAAEVEEAGEEGVRFLFLAAPACISLEHDVRGQGGFLRLECLRMELGDPGPDGRPRPVPVVGSEFTIFADLVVLATGQEADIPAEWNLPLQGGRLRVDPETMGTGIRGVFAAGDLVSGPASVIEAIAAGRKAAAAIDRYLGGRGEIDHPLGEEGPAGAPDPRVLGRREEYAREGEPGGRRTKGWLGREDGFAGRRRPGLLKRPWQKFLAGGPTSCDGDELMVTAFAEVEMDFSEEMAVEEAERCLRCDLRTSISPPVLPPVAWLELNQANLQGVPEREGVFQILDREKQVLYIAGTANLRRSLEEQAAGGGPCGDRGRYFLYEEDPMYTMRESELLQQFLQKHGRLPEGNDLPDDLF